MHWLRSTPCHNWLHSVFPLKWDITTLWSIWQLQQLFNMRIFSTKYLLLIVEVRREKNPVYHIAFCVLYGEFWFQDVISAVIRFVLRFDHILVRQPHHVITSFKSGFAGLGVNILYEGSHLDFTWQDSRVRNILQKCLTLFITTRNSLWSLLIVYVRASLSVADEVTGSNIGLCSWKKWSRTGICAQIGRNEQQFFVSPRKQFSNPLARDLILLRRIETIRFTMEIDWSICEGHSKRIVNMNL